MVHSEHYLGLRPRLNRFIPHKPTKKQRAFLILPHEEAFFGGAAGGGKSDALLMAALQYVDIPGYSTVIIRKTLKDAREPNSIMFRARQWLAPTDAVWRGEEYCWYFPTHGAPARLGFGKLAQIGDTDSYQGAEYQALLYDEITQLYEADFEYVTTRLRRTYCPDHGPTKNFSDSCQSCAESYGLSQVPLRIRSASNPGGKGGIWVKRRYDIQKVPGQLTPNGRQLYAGQHPERPHIPAFVEDNPYLDRDEYVKTLSKVGDPVTREQLLSGDWGVSEAGRFKIGWVKRYSSKPPYVDLDGVSFSENVLQTFIIIDPAASHGSTPGAKELTKKIASYTAAVVFSLTPDGRILIRYADRHQGEVPQTKNLIRSLLRRFPRAQFVGMELSSMSIHLYQMLCIEGFNMRAFKTQNKDKIARAVPACNEMESGRFWFPDEPSRWLQDLEDELFIWTGDKDEVDDQIDCVSYAAIYKQQNVISSGADMLSDDDIPSII